MYFGKQVLATAWPGIARQAQLGKVHSLSAWQATKTQVQAAGSFSQVVGRSKVPPSGRIPPPPEQIWGPGLHVSGAAQSASVAQDWARVGAGQAQVTSAIVPRERNAKLVLVTTTPPMMHQCSCPGWLLSSDRSHRPLRLSDRNPSGIELGTVLGA
jgi:hypothetical protein